MNSSQKIEIKISEIIKSERVILSDLNFSFFSGNIVALVGPNGSGKTSLLTSLFLKRKNSYFVLDSKNLLDLKVVEYAKIVSFLGASDFNQPDIALDRFLENADYLKQDSKKDLKSILEYWNLNQDKFSSVALLSLGEYQKLLLASTLTQSSKIFILDEPERHLDPNSIKLLSQKLLELKKAGATIIFSTHDLNFALSSSDYCLGLKNGKQEFFIETKLAFDHKYFDQIYDTTFRYMKDDNDFRGILT